MINKTHTTTHDSFEEIVQSLQDSIQIRGDLPHISVEEQKKVIEDLMSFPLGRFILEMRGANGFWTDYMITYPERRHTRLNREEKPLSKWEDFLLNRSPVVLASQERYKIFLKIAQSLIKEDIVIASIPCGLMNDLLTLDYTRISRFKIVGIDIDAESVALAKIKARKFQNFVEFRIQNAWDLQDNEVFDVITSNGLNVYEDNPEKVLDLYRRFFKALKPGGVLIIGVLTYPPGEDKETDWDLSGINEENLLMEQILHRDVLGIKWRNFRATEEIEREFINAGFSKTEIIFDTHRIFPTVVAQKSQ
jgi:SAM-dependent methyltransferase